MSPALFPELSWAIYLYSRAVFSEVSLEGKIFTKKNFSAFKALAKERARIGTFKAFGTERARLSTLNRR